MLIALILSIYFNTIFCGVFKNLLGRNGVFIVLLAQNILALCMLIFYDFCTSYYSTIIEICNLSNLNFLLNGSYLSVLVDEVSVSFSVAIVLITSLILIYSVSYMYSDFRISMFQVYLNLFMVSMLVYVFSADYIAMFIGWEGVGIVSYLLINFWFQRIEANKSGIKALIFNRIGDLCFMVYIALLLGNFDTTNVVTFTTNFNLNPLLVLLLGLLIVMAAASKSALLYMYAWLPDAMEGPTPVSALLHSATMVTAGVYLLIRTYSLVNSEFLAILLFITGIASSIFTGVFAIFKYDIKKVIAFSTCSQLGILVCGISYGLLNESYFHMYVHAFFKSILFLSAGVIIHILYDEQDIRKYGGILQMAPLYVLVNIIGSLNIMAFPYLSGFYSKENLVFYPLVDDVGFLHGGVLLASCITLLYSIRLFAKTILNPVWNSSRLSLCFKQPDIYMTAPLFTLAIMAITLGYLYANNYTGLSNYINGLSKIRQYVILEPEVCFFPTSFGLLLISGGVLLIYISIVFSTRSLGILFSYTINNFYTYINRELNIPIFFWYVSKLFNYITYVYILKLTEKGFNESLGIIGTASLLYSLSKNLLSYYTNTIYGDIFIIFTYILILALGSLLGTLHIFLFIIFLYILNKNFF